MKKRIFSIAAALLLLFALLPAAAGAEGGSVRYELTLEGYASARGSVQYSLNNADFYPMSDTSALAWGSEAQGSNAVYSAALENSADIYIKCTPEAGYTVRSSSDNRTIFGAEDAVYTFKLPENSAERVFFTANSLAEANSTAKGTMYNPAYTTAALQAQVAQLEASTGKPLFYATDAYGNILGDDITIARGGSFFLRFKVNPEAVALMFGGDVPSAAPDTYTSLGQLFYNVGWNLESVDGVIEYINETPSLENNWSGGIHIDTLANCGKTVYLDFYISPKVYMGEDLPVNWGTMSQDYVIKKVIKVTVEDSENTGGQADGASVSMAKPIPEGYGLAVAPFDSASLSEKDGYSSGNVANYGVDFTMKKDAAEYPVTNNTVQVSMPLPDALGGCAKYAVSYLEPDTDTIKSLASASVEGGLLSFTATHLSSLIITGSGGAKIGDELYANIDAAAAAAGEDSVIVMLADGTLSRSTNASSGVTINKNGHTLKLSGGSHTFAVTEADLAPHRVVSESGGVYTVSPDTHAVSFNSNGGSAVAPASVTCGQTISRPDDPALSGFTFGGWYEDSGLTRAYDFASTVTSDMTLYAKWNSIPASLPGGVSAPELTVPAVSAGGGVKLGASVSGGEALITVTDEQARLLAAGGGAVKLDVSGLKADSAVIPAKLAGASGEGLEVTLPAGSLRLDARAMESAGSRELTVSIKTLSPEKLAPAQKSALGDRAESAVIVDVNVLVNGAKASGFGGGSLAISIPYAPRAGEDASGLVVWYLAEDGSITPMEGAYNAETKCFEFVTDHLSAYALTCFPFADVAADSYYYGSVAWASANGIMDGKTPSLFAPNDPCTRGMIVTVLYRLEGEPTVSGACPFDDVAAGKYYEKAITWAAGNKIVDGYGDGSFGPEDNITREQLAAILWRYANYKGYDTGAAADLSMFTDESSISSYAMPAMRWANASGLVGGKGGGILDPLGSAERCEAAAILHRFCENRDK